MANIKDFENKRKKSDTAATSEASVEKEQLASEPTRPKRRPASEEGVNANAQTTEVKVVDVESGIQGHSTHIHQTVSASTAADEVTFKTEDKSSTQEKVSGPKVEIHFTGSELIRAKFPRPFDIVEKVATDWVHDGDFSKIPLGHPLAEYAAQESLKQAKKLEKQVLESPATEKIATQVLMAGMKAQGKVQQFKSLISELRSKAGLKK
jgi:hypothetical protein